MGETYKAETPEQILDVVQWAIAEEQAFDVCGMNWSTRSMSKIGEPRNPETNPSMLRSPR